MMAKGLCVCVCLRASERARIAVVTAKGLLIYAA